MTEHRLERIETEKGPVSGRRHFVCSCGTLGPDHNYSDPAGFKVAAERAFADHKLHSEGKSVTEADSHEANPGVKGWSDRIREEGR